MEGWGVREVYGSRRDEAIKEKDEMVLFRFPFWEFLSLCEAARSLSRNCVLWVSVCVSVVVHKEKKKRQGEKIVCKNVGCRNVWESFPEFVSDDDLNYESMAAQSRSAGQAMLNQTKPGLDLLRSTCFVL